jgi:hypothetical protein
MALRQLRQLVSRGKSNANMIGDSTTNIAKREKREELVILGTGWGSDSALKTIDKNEFEVIVASPRNHF